MNERTIYYKLDENKNVIPCKMEECTTTTKASIVKQEHLGEKWISTVFMHINHNYDVGEPLVFETMIKDKTYGWLDYCDRYSTWQEAEEGHKRAVEWVKNGCKEE